MAKTGYVESRLRPNLVACADSLLSALDACASIVVITPVLELKIECAAHLEAFASLLGSVTERLDAIGTTYSMEGRRERRKALTESGLSIRCSLDLLDVLLKLTNGVRDCLGELLSSISSAGKLIVALDFPSVQLVRQASDEIDRVERSLRTTLLEDWSWSRHLQEPTGTPTWLWEGVPLDPPRDIRFRSDSTSDCKSAEGTVSTVARSFHRMLLRTEISTIEVCAHNIVDSHPLPVHFLYDMAKQASDEARHARACVELVLRHGGALGQFESDVGLWQATRDKRLALRLAIHQRAGETVGVNAARFFADQYALTGEDELFNVQELIYHDEIAHVAIGNRWLRILCNESNEALALIDKEAEAAREKVTGVVSARASRYPIDTSAMKRAGYTRAEVDGLTRRSSTGLSGVP
jgi:uncharacterized ferritin-like protein (DUF455 family)